MLIIQTKLTPHHEIQTEIIVQRSSDSLAGLNDTFEQKDLCFKEGNQSATMLLINVIL